MRFLLVTPANIDYSKIKTIKKYKLKKYVKILNRIG